MSHLDKIYASKLVYVPLGVSILYFLLKGVGYLLIGSYIPMIFILTIIILLYWSFTSSDKSHRRMLRFWAILIIVWALVRLGMWLILKIDTTLTESHLREQFGLLQHFISIFMIVIGCVLLKQLRAKKVAVNDIQN